MMSMSLLESSSLLSIPRHLTLLPILPTNHQQNQNRKMNQPNELYISIPSMDVWNILNT